MDDRQRQVKVGAGLEESRINQEFLDWLGKWGPRVLIVLLVIVAAYQGKRFLDQNARQSENQAFVDYHEAVRTNDAAAVLVVGDKHDGVGTLWEMSRMRAGESLMREGTTGLMEGTVDRRSPTPDEILSEEVRTQRLERAVELYEGVIARVEGKKNRVLYLLKAQDALASAMISLGRYDEGRALLESVVETGEESGYGDLAELARERLARWDDVVNPPVVVSLASLPNAARPVVQPPAELNFQEFGRDAVDREGRTGDDARRDSGLMLDPSLMPNVPVRTIDDDDTPETPSEETPATDPVDTPGEG